MLFDIPFLGVIVGEALKNSISVTCNGEKASSIGSMGIKNS